MFTLFAFIEVYIYIHPPHLDRAHTVALAARSAHNVNSELTLAHIVARLGRNRTTLRALVVDQTLQLTSSIIGIAASTILIEGADGTVLALGTGKLDCRLVSQMFRLTGSVYRIGDLPPVL